MGKKEINSIIEGISNIPFEKKYSAELSKLRKNISNNPASGSVFTACVRFPINIMFDYKYEKNSNSYAQEHYFEVEFDFDFRKLKGYTEGKILYYGIDLKDNVIKFNRKRYDGVGQAALCGWLFTTSNVMSLSDGVDNLDPLTKDLIEDLVNCGRSDAPIKKIGDKYALDREEFVLSKWVYTIKDLLKSGNSLKCLSKRCENYNKNILDKLTSNVESKLLSMERNPEFFPKLSNKSFIPILVIDTEDETVWYYEGSSVRPSSQKSGKMSLREAMRNKNDIVVNLYILPEILDSYKLRLDEV